MFHSNNVSNLPVCRFDHTKIEDGGADTGKIITGQTDIQIQPWFSAGTTKDENS